MPRSMRKSVSSSGWCGSGRTISASPPTRRARHGRRLRARGDPRRMCSARFGDMLLAAESHPAMLIYLDNARSIGPNSVAGINRKKRAQREPRARDSRAAYARRAHGLHAGRRHQFRQGDHRLDASCRPRPIRSTAANSCSISACTSPGAQTVLGKTYPDGGVEQGRAVLADLARHPATAKHVATKLARHFIADEPPPRWSSGWRSASSTPTATSRRSPRRWSTAPEAWDAQRAQAQAPGEWIVCGVARDRMPAEIAADRAGAWLSRRAAVAAAGAEGLLRRAMRPGSTVWRNGSTSPTASRSGSATTLDADGDGRDGARPARVGGNAAARSRAPRAASRRWRCC